MANKVGKANPDIKSITQSGDFKEEGKGEVQLIDHKRTGIITVRGYRDVDGVYRELMDINGNPRVSKITKNKMYNLKNLEEALEFYHISNHPLYTLGVGQAPILRVVNHEEDAADKVLIKDLEVKANSIIMNLKGADLRDFGRVLLLDKRFKVTDQVSDNVIKRELYNISEINPQHVITEWESEDRPYRELLSKGISVKKINNRNGIYSYGNQAMGANFELAVEWLKSEDRADILQKIREDILN